MGNCIQFEGTGGRDRISYRPSPILEFLDFIDKSFSIRTIPELVDFIDKSFGIRTTTELADLINKPPRRLGTACFSFICHVFVSLIGRRDWILENVVERDVERLSNSKRHFKGRGISTLLDSDDGLARYTDVACKLCLAHLALGEPE